MNVPKLRFKEFDGEWEEKDFEELLEAKDGIRRGPFGSALKKEFFVPESDYVVYEQQNAIYDKYTTRYNITKDKYEELNKFSLKPGDFIMSGAGTIGRISKVPKGIKKGVFNQALIRFRINSEITDSEYFLQFMRAEKMQRKLTGANPGSAITNLVPMSELKKWSIITPNIKEQQKISKFLKAVDKRIQLQQQKIDLLQEQKKGYMQKIFKQEWRFKEFTQQWKTTTIGSLAEISRGASPRPIQDPKWFDGNSNVGWLRISDVTKQNGRIHYLEQKISILGQEKTRVLETPHLLLSIAATVGKPVINYIPTGVHDGFLIFYNPTFNVEFMFQWLEMFRDNWQKYGQPGSQVNLNSELVKNQEISIPVIEEQQKIAEFLTLMDKKIQLQKEKLELLKKQKQGFMQQMFI